MFQLYIVYDGCAEQVGYTSPLYTIPICDKLTFKSWLRNKLLLKGH